MIVGVSGKGGVGKDVFGSIAVKEFGAETIAFAAGVKEEVAEFLTENEVFFQHRHLWGTQQDKEAILRVGHSRVDEVPFIQSFLTKYAEYTNGYWYFTSRSLMQWWGTEYRRAEDDNYWVKRALAKATDPEKLYVLTDTRFPNEADAVFNVGGIVVRIERPDAPAISNMTHPSEVALDNYKGWSCLIINDETLEDYKDQCRTVLKGFMGV